MLAPISWRVPPRHYGPWEQFVSLLTEGLVERGVDVTLFATADSISRARLVGTAPTGYSEDLGLDAKVWEALHISAVFERAAEFDLIHNSFDFLPLTYSGLVDTPVVTTIHGFSSERIVPVFEKYNEDELLRRDQRGRPARASRLHRHDPSRDRHVGEFDAGRRRRRLPALSSAGSIRDKGAAEAIDVAERTGCRSMIAGIVQDQDVLRSARCAPARRGARRLCRPGRGRPTRSGLLGDARALLHLINFDEPFGFSVVEAMACGTPVIAVDRGSMREIVVDGENGFLAGSLDEAAEAVNAAIGTGPQGGARVG